MSDKPDVIDVPELIRIVNDLQRRATADPDADLGHTEVWVEVAAHYDQEQIEALLDLGRPYGLIPATRRLPAAPTEGVPA